MGEIKGFEISNAMVGVQITTLFLLKGSFELEVFDVRAKSKAEIRAGTSSLQEKQMSPNKQI